MAREILSNSIERLPLGSGCFILCPFWEANAVITVLPLWLSKQGGGRGVAATIMWKKPYDETETVGFATVYLQQEKDRLIVKVPAQWGATSPDSESKLCFWMWPNCGCASLTGQITGFLFYNSNTIRLFGVVLLCELLSNVIFIKYVKLFYYYQLGP